MLKEQVMQSEKIHFTKEKETMLITLYGRALQSRSEHPILRDTWAEDAVHRVDYDFDKLKVGDRATQAPVFRTGRVPNDRFVAGRSELAGRGATGSPGDDRCRRGDNVPDRGHHQSAPQPANGPFPQRASGV